MNGLVEKIMGISLSPETQKLIEEHMRIAGYSTADELVEVALRTLERVQGAGYEQLDDDTRSAIEEAEAQFQRGEGIPLDEAISQLREKYKTK